MVLEDGWRSRTVSDEFRVCVDCRLIGVRPHHIESDFSLRDKLVPKVNGERVVSAGEDRDEVPLEGLYCAFGFVGPFVEGWNTLVSDIGSSKV